MPIVLAGVEPAVIMTRTMQMTAATYVRELMVYFVGSEINQVGMAGMPVLVQAIRGTTYVHPRREGWYVSITFLLLPFPEHFFITFFGAKVTKSCEK